MNFEWSKIAEYQLKKHDTHRVECLFNTYIETDNQVNYDSMHSSHEEWYEKYITWDHVLLEYLRNMWKREAFRSLIIHTLNSN